MNLKELALKVRDLVEYQKLRIEELQQIVDGMEESKDVLEVKKILGDLLSIESVLEPKNAEAESVDVEEPTLEDHQTEAERHDEQDESTGQNNSVFG